MKNNRNKKQGNHSLQSFTIVSHPELLITYSFILIELWIKEYASQVLT